MGSRCNGQDRAARPLCPTGMGGDPAVMALSSGAVLLGSGAGDGDPGAMARKAQPGCQSLPPWVPLYPVTRQCAPVSHLEEHFPHVGPCLWASCSSINPFLL